MPMLPAPRPSPGTAALSLLWALASAASAASATSCVADPPPSPPAAPAARAASSVAPAASSTSAGGASRRLPGCKLPAPLKSDDACSTDADCGVSQPCHAGACVARARSHPPTADTMCTEILACNSADANRCGCFEGRCALIPPS